MFPKAVFICFCLSYMIPTIRTQSPKIVGGTDAGEGQFPYQISLRFNGHHTCGGSILTPRWVLTAAHCVGTEPATDNFTVVSGTNLLDNGGDFYSVEKIIVHEKYDPNRILNDIAVVRTKDDIRYTEKVKSISLPANDTGEGVNLTLSGWGTLSYKGELPNKLQTIKLTSISNSKCYFEYPIGALFGMVSSNNICTLTKKGEGACHGDSGGPLVYEDYQVGITSWAMPCATGKPDVFTRVFAYLSWIGNHTTEAV